MKKAKAFGLLVLTSVVWLAASPALALDEIIVSYAGPTVTFLPAEIARQRGFLREQNLDMKLLLTRSEVDRAALVSGSVDYTLRAGSSFVSAGRGLPVRIILIGTMKPFWGLVVRPEIKSVAELKGKSARIPAILAGSIDSSMMDYGEAFRAKKAGLKLLINAADQHGLIAGGIAANTRKLKEQPDQVRRVLKAMVQALKYIQENPQGTQQVMMNWLKIERDIAADIYELAKNNYTRNGMMEDSMMNPLVTTMLAEANIKGVSPSQLVDLSLLQQALK
jgi:ABC-type nitrate/sulfonate/bicarbonate transport system substrate-binding protein